MICKELIPKLLEFEKNPSAADGNPELRFKRMCTVASVYKKKKLPDGKPACRRCAGPLPPGRKTWCGDVCIADALIRCTPSIARQWVHMRDKGVCAQCGLDTEALFKAYKSAQWEARSSSSFLHAESTVQSRRELLSAIDSRMTALGFRTDQSAWEMEHILPVVEGGSHCGLSGLETLCRPCHLESTKALAGRRAVSRKLLQK